MNSDALTPERWAQISDLAADFLEAADQSDAARDAFLNARCIDDHALRGQVASLLAADKKGRAALGRTGIANAVCAALAKDGRRAAALWIGRTLGHYRIESEIAQGGMGAVYRAVRADAEFEKQVAIKIVGDAAGRSNIQQRFRAERQILASLEHPNIAHLIDGGTTDEGVPYLVMEYVDGEPITTYCATKQLDVAAKLALFRAVCGAVHFAHQRLVVHRDLKPTNIFVTRTGVVKLLDFGIAKMLEPAAMVNGAATAPMTTMLAMTPAYASPEQIKNETITTASDVYALGVVLYELLTGQSPYKSKKTQPLDLAKEICETDPERPSTVVGRATVTNLDEPAPHIDQFSLKRLQRGLRGDLDNIVLMALRKDPARRYASVEQLSEDVLRFTSQQPVLAREDTWRYRTRKFVTRNVWPVALGTAASVALLAATVFATHQASVARAEKMRAEKHFASVRQFANFTLTELHRGIKDLPGSAPVRKLLIQSALGYLDGLAQDAGDDAKLLSELGSGYLSLAEIQGTAVAGAQLGEQPDARRSLDRATELLAAAFARAPRDADTAYTYALSLRKRAEYEWSLMNLDAAAAAVRKAIDVGQATVDAGVATPINRIELAGALITQARTTPAAQATRDQRMQPLRRAQAILEALMPQSLSALDADRVANNLAVSYDALGEIVADKDRPDSFVEAYAIAQKSLAIAERRSRAEPSNKARQFSLGASYHQSAAAASHLKRAADAIEFRRKSLAVYEQLLQSDERDKNARMHVLYATALLAEAHSEEHQMDAAESLLTRGERMQNETDAGSAQQVFHRAAGMLLPAVRAVIEAHRATAAGIASSTQKAGCKRALDAFKQARLAADGLKDLFLDQAEDPLAEVKKRMQACAAWQPSAL